MKSADGFYSIGEIFKRPEFIKLITPAIEPVKEKEYKTVADKKPGKVLVKNIFSK